MPHFVMENFGWILLGIWLLLVILLWPPNAPKSGPRRINCCKHCHTHEKGS